MNYELCQYFLPKRLPTKIGHNFEKKTLQKLGTILGKKALRKLEKLTITKVVSLNKISNHLKMHSATF